MLCVRVYVCTEGGNPGSHGSCRSKLDFFFFMFTHIWFSVNISAMCSFNQSNSFLAEKENSSTSECVICRAEDLSSAIHGAEPTGRRAPLDPFITTLSFFSLYTAPLE